MSAITLDEYIASCSDLQRPVATTLRKIINEAVPEAIEMIFVSHPAFYIPVPGVTSYHKMPMVMMLFFADHVNIFAAANAQFRPRLSAYKMTAKHTLQVAFDKPIDVDLFRALFQASLRNR
jgi:uncharacterized protein YdhG (YjbR/CyaY superfamily)